MTRPQTQDDEALIEAMARAMAELENDYEGGELQWHCWESVASAALTALRNHEGRK